MILSKRRYDAILFDMGYTLVCFYPSAEALELQAYQEAGVQVEADRLWAARQKVFDDYFKDAASATFQPGEERDRATQLEYDRRTLALLGIHDEAIVQAVRDRKEALYWAPGAIRLYPETKTVLKTLQEQAYRLGIVSNWSWNLIDYCKHVGIAEDFAVIMASAYAGCNKPHPGIFRLTLERLGVPPERALHVGDSYKADVLGARAAGLEAILLDRDGQAGDDEWDCPVISDLMELLALLNI
jgi:putative hydrolase of the HAD superfamily